MKDKGIVCPKCGCADFRDGQGRPWRTAKTMNIPGGIRRYKICRHCGHRIRTHEQINRIAKQT